MGTCPRFCSPTRRFRLDARRLVEALHARRRAVVLYWQEAAGRTRYAPGAPGYVEDLRAFVEDFGAAA